MKTKYIKIQVRAQQVADAALLAYWMNDEFSQDRLSSAVEALTDVIAELAADMDMEGAE